MEFAENALDFFTEPLLQNLIGLSSTQENAPHLLSTVINNQTALNNLDTNVSTNLAIAHSNQQNQLALQGNALDSAKALQSSQLTASSLSQQRMYAQQNLQQGNLFQFQKNQQMQNQDFMSNQLKSNQDFQTNLQSSNQSFLRGQTALNAGLNFGGSLISGGLNYLYAKSLMNNQAELQRENFDYTTGKAATALTANGMPSWLAYMPGSASNMPRTAQATSGNNYFNSQLPGNTSQLLWTGSASQLAFGVGDAPMGS
ncbi:hypothetical protein [Nephila clavipes virus 2]|uniref:hypothetical protein n=1 Tax=Nephila clavipes virus 2 TaxID=2108205 RepID=UPI000D221011|nr:hypothetical protein [Nephila clavipes virus 2]AVK59476.1 hypothetical protein [Nephila clavipes virus 2]